MSISVEILERLDQIEKENIKLRSRSILLTMEINRLKLESKKPSFFQKLFSLFKNKESHNVADANLCKFSCESEDHKLNKVVKPSGPPFITTTENDIDNRDSTPKNDQQKSMVTERFRITSYFKAFFKKNLSLPKTNIPENESHSVSEDLLFRVNNQASSTLCEQDFSKLKITPSKTVEISKVIPQTLNFKSNTSSQKVYDLFKKISLAKYCNIYKAINNEMKKKSRVNNLKRKMKKKRLRKERKGVT